MREGELIPWPDHSRGRRGGVMVFAHAVTQIVLADVQ